MIWFQTVIFFFLYTMYLMLMINLYAKLLIRVGTTSKIIKIVLSTSLYLFFSFSFFIPFFYTHKIIKDFHVYYSENNIFFFLFSISYLVLFFSIIMYFNKKWISKLQAFGYFK